MLKFTVMHKKLFVLFPSSYSFPNCSNKTGFFKHTFNFFFAALYGFIVSLVFMDLFRIEITGEYVCFALFTIHSFLC
jgi:tetrahydromethanopterin S-methyltransferase subunit B